MTATQWESKIVGHSKVDPTTLVGNPLNWRAHPRNQREALDAAIEDVGFWQSVHVNRNSGTIVDGHLRVARAVETGQQEIDVEWVDLSPDEERKALLSGDSIAGMARTDRANMDALLRGVKEATTSMRSFLDTLAAKNNIFIQQVQPTRDDPGPLVDEPTRLRMKWRTEEGQVWNTPSASHPGMMHRLVIGDSTDAATIKRLMGTEQADMVWTDPPYGVGYVGKTSDALEIQNDEIDDSKTERLITRAAQAWPLKPGGVYYVCSPGGQTETAFRVGLNNAHLTIRQALVWVKDHFVMGRQDYHWRHETVLYGWRDGAAHFFIGHRNQDTILLDETGPELTKLTKAELIERIRTFYRQQQDTVWREQRPTASVYHPTTKPTALSTKAIMNSTRERGAVVFDGFCGYGGVIVSCEDTGRQARAVELSPAYAAATLERLHIIGLTPTLESEA